MVYLCNLVEGKALSLACHYGIGRWTIAVCSLQFTTSSAFGVDEPKLSVVWNVSCYW